MPLRGDAAFVHVSDAGVETVHRLNNTLGNLSPRHRQPRYSHTALSGRVTTVTVGDGAWEFEGRVRFDALPVSLIRTLQFGANGGTLTYWPSLSGTASYDATLIWPDFVVGLSPDSDTWFRGHYEVTVLLRRTDGGDLAGLLSSGGVVYALIGGGDLTDWTHSRASSAYRIAKGGTLESVATDAARTEWLDLDGDGSRETPSTLLELSRTNRLANPLDFTAWDTSGTPVLTGGQADPEGGTEAYILEDDDGAGFEYIQQAASFSGDGVKAVSLFVREGTSIRTDILLRDLTAGSNRVQARLEWSGGEPAVTMVTGTHLGTDSLEGGWFRLAFRSPSVTAANDNRVRITPAGTDAASTGTIYIYGAQAEDGEFSTSLTTATRSVDILSRALPPALEKPSAKWTRYTRFEAAYDGAGGISVPFIWEVGAPGTGRLSFYWPTNTTLRLRHLGAGGTADANLTPTIAAGDDVEAVVVWDGSDGSGTLILSINGGSVSTATLSAVTPSASWVEANTYINSRSGGSNAGAMNLLADVMIDEALTGTAAEIYAAVKRLPVLKQAA